MEIEALVAELCSKSPDINLIRDTLHRSKDLVNGILVDNGTALHFAARNDCINHTGITEILISEFEVNPNFQNSAGSLPVFWALAACKEVEMLGKTPSWDSVRALILHPRFKLTKLLRYRGSAWKFMINEYYSQELCILLEEAKWKKLSPFIIAKQLVGYNLLI